MLYLLPNEQLAFFKNHFAQSMTELPYSCQPMELWIKSTTKKDEQAIQDLQACMTEFDADQIDKSKPTMRSLQSGLVASPELVKNFKVALTDGRTQAENLLQERVFTKTKHLTATIHRN